MLQFQYFNNQHVCNDGLGAHKVLLGFLHVSLRAHTRTHTHTPLFNNMCSVYSGRCPPHRAATYEHTHRSEGSPAQVILSLAAIRGGSGTARFSVRLWVDFKQW